MRWSATGEDNAVVMAFGVLHTSRAPYQKIINHKLHFMPVERRPVFLREAQRPTSSAIVAVDNQIPKQLAS